MNALTLTAESPSRPARVALVTTELRPGGAEQNLVQLAAGLDRARFAPHVYSLAPAPEASRQQLVARLREEVIPVSFVNVRRPWQFFTAVRRLRAMLDRQRPDLVQSFLFHANVVTAAAAQRMNVPLVAGLRVAQRERLRQFVERRLADRFAAFTCVSGAVADGATSGGLPGDKLHVIPNGLDLRRFEDVHPVDLTTLGVSDGQRVVLFIGRFHRQKGADLLIEAARRFLPRLRETTLLLIGEGPEKPRLQKQAQRYGLAGRVVFAPWQADALPIIAAADLLVLPSRYEGMSNVLLEAAALGKPIVATDVEGVREVLGEDALDQIAPPGDVKVFADNVLQLFNNRSAMAAAGAANRRRAADRFSLPETVRRYADLYGRLLQPS